MDEHKEKTAIRAASGGRGSEGRPPRQMITVLHYFSVPLKAPFATFLGPLKIFLSPVPESLDLSLDLPARPLCPSVVPGMDSSQKSKASVGNKGQRSMEDRSEGASVWW